MINEEKEFEYFYIFGVRSETTKDLRSELCLDFLIEYTSEDLENKELAKIMIENKMLPTSTEEAINAMGLNHLSAAIHCSKIRSRYERLSVHQFKSTFPMTREDLSDYVKSSNNCEYSRKKLIDSKIQF